MVVTASFVLGCLSIVGSLQRASVVALLLGLVLVQAAALFWRRRFPVVVLAFVFAAQLISFVVVPDRESSGPALAFAVYAVSVYDRSPVRLAVAAAAIVLIAAAVALLLIGDPQTARSFIPAGGISLIAWVIGDYVRSRRRFLDDLVERHRQDREQAAEDERLRIARELHDVVAHNVSVIAIQAGAARVTGKAGDDTLKSIEEGARETLSELNKLLGVLRKNQSGPELAPQPSLDQLDALLKPARDAGLEANVKVTGARRSLPAAVDLSAYRIVQEAVTNVLKHANASRLEVAVDYAPDSLRLTISDNGTGPGPRTNSHGRGHGLVGMRERVALFDGDLSTGSSSLGGFKVRATLPVKT